MENPAKFLINGSWHSSGGVQPVVNPFNHQKIRDVYRPDDQHIEQAVSAAYDRFTSSSGIPAHQRASILHSAAAEITRRHEEISRLICQEAGKAIRHARSEVSRAVNTLTLSAEESKRICGETINMDMSPGTGRRTALTRRFPLGPVAAITPFNFPLNLVCHKVGPAIAAGNPVILKPASATPLTALVLAEILLNAGLPPGMLHVLPASSELADQLVTDPRIAMLSFTGSAEVGWSMKGRAGAKKVCLELGGNGAAVIHADADLDYAVERCLMGSFAFAGQVCISVQRIIVHRDIYEPFLDAFCSGALRLIAGNPADESVDIGPMIDRSALEKAALFVEDAVSHGGRIRCGGHSEETIFLPTVITDAGAQSLIWQEEAFSPMVTVTPYADFSQALDLVNDSHYGLQAGIFTASLDNAFLAFEQVEAGGVIINDVPTFRVDQMPYGGVKNSGFGREGVKYTIEEMTEPKLLVINHHP